MMLIIVVLGATALVLVATSASTARQRARKSLTARKFALAVTAGWRSSIAIFYFLGISLASDIDLTKELVGLGLGILFINLVLGYPASIFVYRRILPRVLLGGKAPPDTP